MGRTKGTLTIESLMIANGKAGDHFYSDKMDRHLTAMASYHKRKILTERLITVNMSDQNLKASKITKVTLL